MLNYQVDSDTMCKRKIKETEDEEEDTGMAMGCFQVKDNAFTHLPNTSVVGDSSKEPKWGWKEGLLQCKRWRRVQWTQWHTSQNCLLQQLKQG